MLSQSDKDWSIKFMVVIEKRVLSVFKSIHINSNKLGDKKLLDLSIWRKKLFQLVSLTIILDR